MKKELRLKVYNKYERHCAYCGIKLDNIKKMEVDHIRPQRKYYQEYSVGEKDNINNLNPSCRVCNRFKGGMSIEELRGALSMQIDRARNYSINYRMAEKYKLVKVLEKDIVFCFEQEDE